MWTIAARSPPRGGVVGVAAFHRAAFNAARHGSTTMDTLVRSGSPRRVHLVGRRVVHRGHIYFEVAVTVTTFLLAGRCRGRAKRAGEAVTALLKPVQSHRSARWPGGVHPDRAVGRR